MRAVLMAGGRGTRMLPYTTVLPKPLLPVGERPILSILLEQLAGHGTRRVDLCVGYLGELIRAYLSETTLPEGLDVAFHTEEEPLGTAGALNDLPALDTPFLSLNGDVLTDLDFAALMRQHVDTGAALTVAVQPQETAIASGVLELDGDRVRSLVEKPVLTHLISLGIYAVSPRALEYLPEGYADMPGLVDTLLAAGEDVRAYRHEGVWFDIGTIGDHEVAVADLHANPARYLAGSDLQDAG